MNDSDIAADTNFRLRKFALQVAGPRDFIINLAINGTIAWWVFGDRELISLAEPDSIFVMLLPMAFIESTLTTFFGFRSGAVKLDKLNPSAKTIRGGRWYRAAASRSLICGASVLVIAVGTQLLLRFAFPSVMLAPRSVVLVIGLSSGALAYVLHARAVITSPRI